MKIKICLHKSLKQGHQKFHSLKMNINLKIDVVISTIISHLYLSILALSLKSLPILSTLHIQVFFIE